jgi:hypothetical protein
LVVYKRQDTVVGGELENPFPIQITGYVRWFTYFLVAISKEVQEKLLFL